MGSVLIEEKCEKCNGVKMVNSYYRIGNEYSNCLRCGFTSTLTPTEEVFNDGYGTYKITRSYGIADIGVLKEPLTDERLEEFKSIFEDEAINMEDSYLAKWEDNKQVLVFGSVPPESALDFEEVIKVWEEQAKQFMLENFSIEDANSININEDKLPF